MQHPAVFEQEKGEMIQEDARRGAGCIGDEVGDIAGSQSEDELAQFF